VSSSPAEGRAAGSASAVEVVDQLSDDEQSPDGQTTGLLANPRFLALFLSQIFTQVGGNMVLYGLTVQVYFLTHSSTSVSILLLVFLVPAVLFGAVAGVYSDRFDRRLILVATNVARAACFLALVFVDSNIGILYVLMAIVATLTTFFAPAEASMMPLVVEKRHLLSANGLYVFTLQASFVLGFAVLGPLFQRVVGTEVLIAIVAGMYLLAALMCWILPSAPPSEKSGGRGYVEAERALSATFSQLREGISYIRSHRKIFWSLLYLAITASLIGVLGVLGPDFAVKVLGLSEADFVIIVLPLGAGLIVGILTLNSYGRYVPRRRLIESGLIAIAISLIILGLAQRLTFISSGSGFVSLLTVVMAVAFAAGVSYAFVAVPSQTQLQEELPSEVRGRVFGVLNMLVSLASFVPIIIVGPVADLVGTPAVIVFSAVLVGLTGVASIFLAHPAVRARATPGHLEPVDPVALAITSSELTRTVRLRYLETADPSKAPIDLRATPVIPGRQGPAPAPDVRRD
jgi:MFS family permease